MHLPWHDKWSLSLLKRSTPFIWTDDLNKVLHQSKGIITDGIKEGLCLFDPDRPTCHANNWSVDGNGFFIMQMCVQDSCLLQWWLEIMFSWKQIYTPSWKQIRSHQRWCLRSCVYTPSYTLLCTGMQGPHCCYGPQTFLHILNYRSPTHIVYSFPWSR